MPAKFPRLNTGAVAQYPSARHLAYATQTLRFLDGGEQRYRDQRRGLRRWTIDLTRLSEPELNGLARFFVEMRGSYGLFEFEDPWTGVIVANCRFESDELVLAERGEYDGAAQLSVMETL
jgi:hypothetical protein